MQETWRFLTEAHGRPQDARFVVRDNVSGKLGSVTAPVTVQ